MRATLEPHSRMLSGAYNRIHKHSVSRNPHWIRGGLFVTKIRSRVLSCAALLLGAGVLANFSTAAEYPSRPIRYVVPYAPGGINDIVARIVGQKLNEAWGQPVIVDNRPGAGGNLGTELVARATPDGYTILSISAAQPIAQTLYTKLGYNLERDLAPVVLLGGSSLIMVINPSLPVRKVSELADWSRKNHLIYGSGGVGVSSHLAMEMFKQVAKIQATHVPYKGFGPALGELIAGQIHVMTNSMLEVFPHAKGGKLRLLGIMAEKRHAFLPEVATFPEQGYKELVMSNWIGLVAPAGTPRRTAEKLAGEVTRILKLPDVADRLSQQGFDPGGGTQDQFGKLVTSETARYAKVVTESGAKVD